MAAKPPREDKGQEKKKRGTFLARVLACWGACFVTVGMVAIFFGLIPAAGRSSHPAEVFIAGVVIILAGSLVLAIPAALMTYAVESDTKKAVDQCLANNDSRLLLCGVYNSQVPGSLEWTPYCEALVRVGSPCVGILKRSLDPATCPQEMRTAEGVKRDVWLESNVSLRAGAAYVLGEMHETSCVPDLTKALSDEDSTVRKYVIEALAKIGASQALVKALTDEDAALRKCAVEALANIGDPGALDELRATEQYDESSMVKKAAKEAIAAIRGRAKATSAS